MLSFFFFTFSIHNEYEQMNTKKGDRVFGQCSLSNNVIWHYEPQQ